MATATVDLMLDSSTDVNFREWGQAIGTRLAGFGWVKSSDTGQINWSTVTTSTSTGSNRGFEVWRMDDALQASAPVFMRIDFMTGIYYAKAPRIYVQLGTGTNGAGVLTGQFGAVADLASYNSLSGTTRYRCLFSGDASRFGMCLGVDTDGSANPSYHPIWLIVERTRDTTGADTTEGVVRVGSSAHGSGLNQQLLPLSGPVPPNETGSIGCLSPSAGTGVLGNDVVLYPIYPFQGEMKNPVRGAAGYFKTDIAQDWVFQASIYGITQNFYAVGHAVPGPMVRASTGTSGLALRWE